MKKKEEVIKSITDYMKNNYDKIKDEPSYKIFNSFIQTLRCDQHIVFNDAIYYINFIEYLKDALRAGVKIV